MFKDIKVEQTRIELNAKDFTPKELSLIDIKGLSRSFLRVSFKEINDNVINALRDFIKNQYKLPMKYIEEVDYKYSACKRAPNNDKDNPDYLYIEPLNNNYPCYIRYIPINQALPLDTNIIIDIDETKMPDLVPNYYFFRSNSLQTDPKIEETIKKIKPNSIYTKPWLQSVHIGSLDIDSKLFYKGKVAMINTDNSCSFTLFGFHRDDEHKYFEVFTYDCYNVVPKEIFEMMLKQPGINSDCKSFCEAVLSKTK
jgi:hypothetical protein